MESEITREIPRREWSEFFNGFSQQHMGWLVTLELLDRELGAQVVAENLPLRSISSDIKDGEDIILVNVGATAADHANHAVPNPTYIRLQLDDQGAHQALEIETASGATTLLRFRVTALPETLDGVASFETVR